MSTVIGFNENVIASKENCIENLSLNSSYTCIGMTNYLINIEQTIN